MKEHGFRRSAGHSVSDPEELVKPKVLGDYLFELIKESGLFDVGWYLQTYGDRLAPGENPLAHYLARGVKEGLNPSPRFNTRYYLESNPDVAAAGINPFIHYILFGRRENRWPLPYHDLEEIYPVAAPQYVPRLPPDAGVAEKAVRVIAFYLPQFHPIPENDAWWGEGFTEWTNVRRAVPQFEGHYQPHEPDEFLGYYDLRDRSVQARQIELAKQYGIEGFCFYFYWFSGKRLLELPVENYLNDPSLDLPFCLCWANENWTRRWDGLDKEILIAQHHSDQDDLAFIQYVAKYLRDPRYIRVLGKPLLLVYRPSLFPDIRATAQRWRTWCRDNGIGEIYLAYPQSFDFVDPAIFGFDAAIEFPPSFHLPDITRHVKTYKGFEGIVYEWRWYIARSENYPDPGYKLFRGVNPGWDNTARRKNHGRVFHNSSPQLFARWLNNAFADTLRRFDQEDERLVFINAWNEWAEGSHLEPDRRYGYAWLLAVREAHQSALQKRRRIVLISHDAHPHGAQLLCLHFARYFKEQMHFEVDLILLGGGPLISKYRQYARVHQLLLNQVKPEQIDRLLSALRQCGVDVAIANTTVSGLLVPYLKQHGFTVLSLIHELPGILRAYCLEAHAAAIAKHADKVVFPAPQVQQGFEHFVGQPLPQAVIRPQGLYWRSPLRSGADKEAVRKEVFKELGLPPEAKLILCAGYADYRKGFDLFVQASLKVFDSIPNAYALWVGHRDETLVAQTLQEAEKRGERHRFLLPGLVDEPQRYYLAADVYALTSREDPFPTVVMEALDSLTPVVAFRGAGGFENLLQRGCGILVPKEDVAAFAQALIGLLQNPAQARALAETGRTIVEQEFNFRHYLFDLLELAGKPLPRVSAIVPNYNYARYLPARLESVVRQTLPLYELIVLDDCSTDDSVRVAQDFLRQEETPWCLEVNTHNSGSVFRQWHKGLLLARGDYVWIAEADDLADPAFLQTVVPYMQANDAVLGFCDSWQIDEEGKRLGNSYKFYVNEGTPGAFDHDFVMEGPVFLEKHLAIKNVILNVSGVVFRRDALMEALARIGDELFGYKVAGDWRIYVEICAMGGRVAYVAKPLNGHRRHRISVTHASQADRHLREIEIVQQLAYDIVGSATVLAAQQSYKKKVIKWLSIH
jgi:glycosyltransferase involved in cell wall biosynthesis